MLVVPPRANGYALYLPCFGLALSLAAMLARWLPAAPAWRWAAAALCALLIAGTQIRAAWLFHEAGGGIPMEREIRELAEQAPVLAPRPAPAARFLLVNSPIAQASQWTPMFALALRYGRRDVTAKILKWDPVSAPLKVDEHEFDYVLLYDPHTRRYREVTAAARAGLDRMPPPSRAAMGAPEAELCIVHDIGPVSDGKSRWCNARPEFRFTAPNGGASRFFLRGYLPKEILDKTGPLQVRYFVNDIFVRQAAYGTPGPVTLVCEFPARLPARMMVRIRLEVLNPMKAGSDLISFTVDEAGME